MRTASIAGRSLLAALLGIALFSTNRALADTQASLPVKTLEVSVAQLPGRVFLDAGQLQAGESLNMRVALQIELDMPLSIRSVEADCGCLKVQPEQGEVAIGNRPTISVDLAPSRKLGRIRRNLRVYFDQQPTSPLDVAIDTHVVGPLRFESPQVTVGPIDREVRIEGTITSAGVRIVQCDPTRGSCRVIAVEQSGDRFTVLAQSLISFGTANELFRVHYVQADIAEPVQVDLPMELRYTASLRFFPSVASLRWEDGSWHVAARLVTAPDPSLDLQELKLAIVRTDGQPLAPETFRVELRPVSAVLYQMLVRCDPTDPNTDRPIRLTLASPSGEILASLDFSSP